MLTSAKNVQKFVQNLPFSGTGTQNFANILSLNPEKRFLFTTDKQHVCGEQKMVLVVLLYILVNFRDLKFCRLQSRGKSLNFLYIISFHSRVVKQFRISPCMFQ